MAGQQQQQQRQSDYRQGDGTRPDAAATFGDRPARPDDPPRGADIESEEEFDIREQHQDPFQHG